MGGPAMKQNILRFESTLPTPQIGMNLNQAYGRLRASVESIQASSNPLETFGQNPEISVVGSGKSLLGGSWAVQAFVTDTGPVRQIELIALGDSAGSRVFNGAKNTLSLGKSNEKLSEIVSDLRSEDPSFQEQ